MTETAPPLMEPSVVCFLDVLGSTQLMTGPRAATDLVRLKAAVDRATQRYLQDHAHTLPELQVIWFTDNVVLALPLPDDDGEVQLGMMFDIVSWFALEMSLAGFFVRGGIALGDVYVDKHFAFGPALIEAVKLEKDVATHPRVVLSDDVLGMAMHQMKSHGRPWDSPYGTLIIIDDKLVPFLSHLSAVQDMDPDIESREDVLAEHRRQLLASLQATKDRRVLDKFHWLARYHNDYCARAFAQSPELRVDDWYLGLGFTELAQAIEESAT